jgi:FHA domain-containing protein
MPPRSRRRWAMAAGVTACWALLLAVTGSLVAGTALLLVFGALGAGCVLGLRSMGVNADHPWMRQLAARPWRDGQDVLRLGLRHLADVFVITPAGALVAPNSVQLLLNPGDFGSLCELMDPSLISSSATEVYQEQVAARGARWAAPGPVEVSVTGDLSVPPGRYRLRQGRLPQPGPRPVLLEPAGGFRYAHDGHTRGGLTRDEVRPAGTATGLPTMAESAGPAIPQLRLVTGDSVVQTRTSGARAGRGEVDLVLPQVPTVSREHARFTFTDGQWWIANLGRNGLTLNGAPLVAGQSLRDGDSIRWGNKPDALVSRVEIG